MVVTSDLQQQQQRQSVNNNNNKLKLLVIHGDYEESDKLTVLSTEDNSLRSITHPLINCPFASSNHELLLCDDSNGGIILWNPTTDEVKILPQSSVPRPPSIKTESEMYHGFGFDPNSLEEEQLDYKVVRFLLFRFEDGSEPDNFQVELYSLKTDSWKEIAIPPNIGDMLSESFIHINGFHYWLAVDSQGDGGFVIIQFDFANDKFSSSNIPLPQTDKLYDDLGYDTYILVEFEGSLAVVAYSLADVLGTDEKPFEFEIWVWNDDDESWTRKQVCQIFVSDGSAGIERPLGMFQNDKLYLQDFMHEIVVFDCGNGRLTSTGLIFNDWAHIFPYIESSAEEIKHGEIISNSTTSKLAPVVTDSKHKHNNNSNNKLKLLIEHEYEGIHYFSQLSTTNNNSSKADDDSNNNNNNVSFNFPSVGACFCLAASCNNALLLCYVGNKDAALWNPTTDNFKKLPDDVPSSRGHITSSYGFGFDPKPAAASQDHDYKVIRFIKNDYLNDLQVELYSLKTDSWKDITSLYPLSESPTSQPPIHINGFSYWLAPVSPEFIISFDFADEKFSSPPHIPLPPLCQKKLGPPTFPLPPRHDLLLTEFHGSLAALVYTNVRQQKSISGRLTVIGEREKPFQLEIWVWTSDELSSWAKVSEIHVPDADVEEPLGLIGNDQLYLKGSNGEVLLYDYAKGGELKNLGLKATHISSYIESSFPLNGNKLIRADYKIINH